MTPVRSSVAEVLLCLKRDSSDGMQNSQSQYSEEELDSKSIISSIEETNADILSEEIVCNCKKSRCLKLYCQCFAGQIVCNPLICKCTKCANTPSHGAERADAVKTILERNPLAFASKFKREDSNDGTKTAHKTGCRCRKSMCLKKYCECFHAGVPCSTSCTCLQCANLSMPPRSSSAASIASARTPAAGVVTAKRSSPPMHSNTPEEMMRAAQDLELLRNKDSLHSKINMKKNKKFVGGVHVQADHRLMPRTSPPYASSSTPVALGKSAGGSSGLVPASFEHFTPNGESETLDTRKRARSESPPMHDLLGKSCGGGGGSDRPPSILTRGGGKQRSSPPLSSSSVGGRVSPKLLLHPPSHTAPASGISPRGDVEHCDLNMLSTATSRAAGGGAGGFHFQRLAPPALRISSASPNSLYCASALSLLSGRDMSPQSLGGGFPVSASTTSATAFFATSPVPYAHRTTADSIACDDKRAKKRKEEGIEGSHHQRPHAGSLDSSLDSSLDNTSEEDVTSTAGEDSPFGRLLPAPPSGPPSLSLPLSASSSLISTWESEGHGQNLDQDGAKAFLHGVMYSSVHSSYNNHHSDHSAHVETSSSSDFPSLECCNEGNWAKPVVDVMSKLS